MTHKLTCKIICVVKFRGGCIYKGNCGESYQTTKQNLVFHDILCVRVCACACVRDRCFR